MPLMQTAKLQCKTNDSTYGWIFFSLGLPKPTKELRAGFTYDSMTWYRINDELSQA
jgi:hypothetical protein